MAIKGYDRLLVRGGTEAEWLKYNPVLKENEEALVWFDKDSTHPEKTCMSKHGDGIRSFEDLPYDDSRDRRYTAIAPITDNVGGFKPGEQPVEIPYNEIIDKLLHPYVAPDVKISSESYPSGVYKRNGIIDIGVSITVVEKSHHISNLYQVKIITKIDGIEETVSTNRLTDIVPTIEQDPDTKYYTNMYQDDINIDTDAVSKLVIAYDTLDLIDTIRDESDYNSNILEYKFVDPVYLGYIDVSVDNITTDIIDSSFKKEIITDSNSISWDYSVNDAKIMILYPVEKGELTSIKDINGLELINSFTTQDITYNNINYKLSIFNNIIYDSKGTLICKFEKE